MHRCGNGFRETIGSYTEACDDGNSNNGDGCSSTCTVETGYGCTGGTPTTADSCIIVCGDGNLDPSEDCDDGNAVDNDGCSSCAIDEDHTCTRSPSTSPDTCSHKCGNGLSDPLGSYSEACDDSNIVSGDGCSSTCTIEDAYTCPTTGAACVHKCGNGQLDPSLSYSEECDDGNLNNSDGCSNTCIVEDAYTCTGGTVSSADTCTHRCGNGNRDSNGGYTEECDDGNSIASDGCTSCIVDDAYICTGNSPDVCTHRCGNGVVDSTGTYTEACDDGNLVSSDGCSNGCVVEDDYTCIGTSPSVCTHKCGNGARETLNSYVENCDDGNTANGDGCSDSCEVEDAFTCVGSLGNMDVCTGRCGNGALDTTGTHTEVCDDGNVVSGDGCTSTCAVEEAFICTRVDNTASNPSSCVERCGNSALDSHGSYTEFCDDGNTANSDGCSSTCTIEDAFICSRADNTASNPDICTA